MNHLMFTIESFLMSWGTRTATDNRVTDQVPTKSAVIGMLCAALGIDREEKKRLQQMQDGYQIAFCLLRHGQVITDYHTVLAGRRNKSKREVLITTRKQEVQMLSDPSDNVLDGGTTQTYREYVEDGMVMVCLRPKNDDVPSCEELKKALIEPKWTLHLGRKCCVPTLPFNPRLIEADTFEGAFDAVELSEVEKDRAFDQFQLYCWEGSKDEFNGVPTTEVRQDRAKTESYGISTGPYRYGRREEHRILRQKEMQ